MTRDGKARTWLKRLGVAGFGFFLIKGLLWLTVPIALPLLAAHSCGSDPSGQSSSDQPTPPTPIAEHRAAQTNQRR